LWLRHDQKTKTDAERMGEGFNETALLTAKMLTHVIIIPCHIQHVKVKLPPHMP
jgi:hypothetical protein